MKRQTYLRIFEDEDEAEQLMRIKNRAARDGSVYCLVEHPEGWALCDLRTAIETELPYRWEV